MANKSSNKSLRKANADKKDEFYTQLVDIEKELKYYKDQFRNKVVYCNCDDPFESNFFKYFASNFNALGLKRLTTTSYVKSPIVGGLLPLFELEGLKPRGKEPFKIEITEVPDADGDGAIDLNDVKSLLKHNKKNSTPLRSNGDFRSDECIELLKKADIVVTNPPFSLFREYVAQLVKYKKKFLIMGNQNAITYKEIFKLIKENRLWLGQSLNGRNILFQIPDYYESYYKIINGKKYAFPKGVVWFTNLDVPKRNEELVLYKKYTKVEYPKYDNYSAINVDRTEQIPMDYPDVMGVPITFLHKYNPNQFEIVDGLNRYTILNVAGLNENAIQNHLHMTEIGGKSTYFRVLIKNKKIKK